ncbi:MULTISPECIES: NAD-dependent epimerase/dehydratase family protein [unclassified Brevibacterium]|uniref:NAD-dependent epimerase/dehydratase family protein n=1 Tax=unclassified Brevibacterium TaxID=2614124 RepID=UPI0022A9C38A|nr:MULTISPECIES: NAD-dependent epimerase/dehydratase family protein [unclassified Brevibacterium]MDK8434542.1 NAD-dependent epimerase/dehydratase family protein [Brevibacterium sp. H-BE7]
MRITVIGATGMVGSHVVAEAADRGHEITAVSRNAQTDRSAEPAAAYLIPAIYVVSLFLGEGCIPL